MEVALEFGSEMANEQIRRSSHRIDLFLPNGLLYDKDFIVNFARHLSPPPKRGWGRFPRKFVVAPTDALQYHIQKGEYTCKP
ncbi:hypothetical protein CH367_18650 [Leptospira barantonii]|uniref:Uncharacterized protein n=1 Tax=Leptospira barantonii TaxID=2023184 RepID=A0ABX4NGK1_9LEPT|nr:hypothetical protein CH367_18650 [Leptospira barantonii]